MRSRHAVLWALLAILVVLAVYGFIIVRRGFSAKAEPSALETIVARTVRNLSLAASTRNLKNPLPATPENIREGLERFADHCAFCQIRKLAGTSIRNRRTCGSLRRSTSATAQSTALLPTAFASRECPPQIMILTITGD